MAYLGEEPKFGSFASETFSGNGSATSFTLTHGAASPSSLLVTIDGVKQQTTAYTITDTSLDFGSGNAPAAGTNNIEVVYLGTKSLVGAVADGAITTSKIVNNAVTGAKMADDAVGVAELSATGTASATTFLRGDNALASAAAGLASVQTFTSSGTWTRPSGITKVIIEVQGAGGGGGNSLSSGDNNVHGAGGGYCKKLLDVSSISTSTITIGTGGTGTAYNVSAAGTDGGASSWADGTNTITGGGGDGGDISPSYVVSVGGTATGGDVNIVGQTALVNAFSNPGNSVLGFGGTWRANTSAAGTQDGKGYGGGGATWSGYSTGGTGTGSQGIVIVWEYK